MNAREVRIMFLYEAIQEVLRQNHNTPMPVEEIASQTNRQGLYSTGMTNPFRVGFRAIGDIAKGNPPLFDVLIRLR